MTYDYARERYYAEDSTREDPEVRAALKRIEQNKNARLYHEHAAGDRCYMIDGEWRYAIGHIPCPNPSEDYLTVERKKDDEPAGT